MKLIPVLMTASVSTRGMKGACFTDSEREDMYAEALSYYASTLLRNPAARIVFAENSGWDLSRLSQRLPKETATQVEFIALPPEEFDISKGKGYNEVLLISKAIDRSAVIKPAGAFLKVTGRYPIYNLPFFVKHATKIIGQGKSLYCDIKDHKLYDWLRLGWNGHACDCRIFASTVKFFEENIGSRYAECNDYKGLHLEGLMFRVVKINGGGGIYDRFPREPHFGGLEGSNVQALTFSKQQDSFKGKTKRFIGNIIRLTMPWFKF